MEMKIRVLNVSKCEPKDKEPYTRMEYVSIEEDKIIKTEKCKGYILNPVFMKVDVFDKIPADIINQDVIAVLSAIDNPRNPLKPYVQITALKTRNGTINLVQS